jgi:hypothetical protein
MVAVTHATDRGRAGEHARAAELWAWVLILAALLAIDAPSVGITTILVLAAALLFAWIDPPLAIDRRVAAIGAAVAAWPAFFLLRSNFLNADGHMLTPKFERDVPALGAHLAHDEILELFVHSRVWYYTHRWWGWSVIFSYQVVSCAAGCVFVYALLRLARRLAPDRTWLFLAGTCSGAYMQLFFGDAENYTITAALVVLYLIAAARFIARETAMLTPMLTLAAAMAFHLEAGWLLPSAMYLCALSRLRSGGWREAGTAVAAAAGVVAAVFVYFHFNGLPLIRFFSSHAGNALRLKSVFSFGMPASYFADQARLLLLLCPAVGMLIPALVWRTRDDELTRFLVVCAASMLALQAVWKSEIGVFEDWNLYAIGGLLAAIVVWRYAAARAVTLPLRLTAAGIAAIGALHTYAWIVANHRHPS